MKLQIKLSDPLIVDRGLDLAYIILWLGYGLWGATTFLIGLPTVSLVASDSYQTIWSGMIGLLSFSAFLWASLVWFKTSWIDQITKKRLERGSVIVLVAFVSIYPGLLIIRALTGEFLDIGGAAVLAFTYVIFPIYRIHILRKRIKALKMAVIDATP